MHFRPIYNVKPHLHKYKYCVQLKSKDMEIVDFNYYSYKPRIRVSFRLRLHTVPVIGDFIHVPPNAISEVSKKMKERDLIIQFGADFKVTKRTKYCTTARGEDWRIDIIPVDEFQEVPD